MLFRSLDFGISAYLTKPARSAVLLGTVIATIQKSRSRDNAAHFARTAQPPAEPHAFTLLRSEPASDIPSSGGAQIDILVAEDNEVNQLVFGQILSGLGLSYRIAGNGRTAVEMHRSLKPKLVLMDVSMPEMNGYEATRAIREAEAAEGAHTPIVGVTAHALKGDREKCLEAGASDYISKPIDIDQLLSLLRVWLFDTTLTRK